MYFDVVHNKNVSRSHKQRASDYQEEISCRNKKWFSQSVFNYDWILQIDDMWVGKQRSKRDGHMQASMMTFFILMTTLTEVLTEALTFWFPSYRQESRLTYMPTYFSRITEILLMANLRVQEASSVR